LKGRWGRGLFEMFTFEADLRKVSTVLRWCTVVSGGFLVFTGVFGLVTLFTTAAQALRNPLGFIVMLYVAFFGLLIIFGEIGRPRFFFRPFGFLKGRWGRGLFEMFTGSLAITAGVSDSDTVSKVLLIVSGAVIVSFSFLNVFFGKNHEFAADAGPTHTTAAASASSGSTKTGRGWFWGKRQASGTEDTDQADGLEKGGVSAPAAQYIEPTTDASSRRTMNSSAVSSGHGQDSGGGWLTEATRGVPRKPASGRAFISEQSAASARSQDPNRAI
jgi:hypothetical protein